MYGQQPQQANAGYATAVDPPRNSTMGITRKPALLELVDRLETLHSRMVDANKQFTQNLERQTGPDERKLDHIPPPNQVPTPPQVHAVGMLHDRCSWITRELDTLEHLVARHSEL